jgi:hypothetical protein
MVKSESLPKSRPPILQTSECGECVGHPTLSSLPVLLYKKGAVGVVFSVDSHLIKLEKVKRWRQLDSTIMLLTCGQIFLA